METRYRVASGVELKLDESVCPQPSGRRHRWGEEIGRTTPRGPRRVRWGEEIGRTSGLMEVLWVDLILIADDGRKGIGSNNAVRLGEGEAARRRRFAQKTLMGDFIIHGNNIEDSINYGKRFMDP
ncbi:hypothetical protein CRG98_011654 [Punica granatum]|uniref:Uncharacterized protein n=1 Tax=Punica granatum TaxID=22663 RepID=A0A2I0KHU1_PUNGR|nr:hypothetical protein CRG98_011654 [Punica granatum]